MIRKIIRIGSSAGIIIPKKELEEHGLKIGDEVKIIIEHTREATHEEFIIIVEKLMGEYKEDLKNLAKR